MTTRHMVAVLAAVAMVSGLTGCAMFNRGTVHYNRTTTIGKELVDLQDAKAKGAISDEEYTKAKKEILEGGPLKVERMCAETK
ncbi:MAG: SHOCT domain-containing protein [bacterium]